MTITTESIRKTLSGAAAKRSGLFLVGILALVALLVFWRIGQSDLREWDESRNGVNAYEMLQYGDFVNTYYGKALDTWNAKPPLMIWMIALSYKFAGFNKFALRLPAAIGIILFFLVAFRLFKEMEGPVHAVLVCLVLLSCKAVLGEHVGLTGDYDALLLLFLTASAYCFHRYIERGASRAILLSGLFTGCAFLTKGTAAFIFLPGMVLYALARGRLRSCLRDRHVWSALLTVALFVGAWCVIVSLYGKTSQDSVYGSENALETLVIHDTFRRLASTDFEQTAQRDPLFLIKALDARMNMWNYVVLTSLITGGVVLFRRRRTLWSYLRNGAPPSAVFSVCLILPLSVVLTVAASPRNWYLAPVFPFFAFLAVRGMAFLRTRWRPLDLLLAAVFLFTFSRNIFVVGTQTHELHDTVDRHAHVFRRCGRIVTSDNLRQNVALHLAWLQVPVHRVPEHELERRTGEYALIRNGRFPNTAKLRPVLQFDEYHLVIVE